VLLGLLKCLYFQLHLALLLLHKNYQEELSSIFAKYLGQKGYKNVAVYNKTKKYKGEVDLVITLEPSGLNRPDDIAVKIKRLQKEGVLVENGKIIDFKKIAV
jgi:hypothetical protein